MNKRPRKPAGLPKIPILVLCLIIFCAVDATSVPSCERQICIDLEHLSGFSQIQVPPDINYVLKLPEKPRLDVKVYVHLMRANTATGQFEIINSTVEIMPRRQTHPTWDPSKTPRSRKRSDRFVLAASLDPNDTNPRSVTREFAIKWGEH